MDTKSTEPQPAALVLDPLHRVFVPVEKQMSNGNFRFRTSDNTRYTRLVLSGAIVRTHPKPLSKKERRKLKRGTHAVSN